MSYELTGKLIAIGNTQQVSDRFKKREFVLETNEDINGNVYTNYAKFQAVQNKCDIVDKYKIGDMVTVSFNVKGNKWEKDGKTNYITNLDMWRMDKSDEVQPQGDFNRIVDVTPNKQDESPLPF